MSSELPFSAPCERNKDVIHEQLASYFKKLDSVFEIGSGTAQHAIHFAKQHPDLSWQTSDRKDYIAGIEAQLNAAKQKNVLPPITLDVDQSEWLNLPKQYPAVFTANTFHIMPWRSVENFFNGLPKLVNQGGYLFIYGPFKYDGEFTSQSNADFDESLRSRGVGSAIRDFEAINDTANRVGFKLVDDISMPANNQLLIWQMK